MDKLTSVEDTLQYYEDLVKYNFKQDLNYDIDFSTVNGQMMAGMLKAEAQTTFLMKDLMVNKLIPQAFALTSNDYYLQKLWGETYQIFKNEALGSEGYIIQQGELTASIPQGTLYFKGNNTYSSRDLVYIQSVTLPYNSLTELNGRIVVQLEQDFLLADGIIMKSIEDGYTAKNVEIRVESSNSFSFEKIKDVNIIAQTGNVVFELAQVYVNCLNTGKDTNLTNGTELGLLNPVANLNETAHVSYDGLMDGVDAQTLSEYRDEILFIDRNVPQSWTQAALERYIRLYDNSKFFNDKIYIPRAQRPTGVDEAGYTTIYMLNPNLSFLSQTELDNIKKYLLENFALSSDIDEYLAVINPKYKYINVEVKITNNQKTLDMIDAIKTNMDNFQQNSKYCWFAQTVKKQDIIDALRNTIDKNNVILGDNFTLNSPLDDVNVAFNEFPIITTTVL